MKTIKWIVLTLLICMATSRPAKAQDMEATQELQDLMTKMAAADDVCPFMPRLRILVNRIAKSVPEMYETMKPQLDELNKTGDETCAAPAADHQAAQSDQVSATAASSIPAVADAKATQDRSAAQRPSGARRQGTGDKFHCVGASGADTGYNNGCQLVPGTNSGANGSSDGSTASNKGGNSPARVVATTGGSTSSANSSNSGSTGTASKYVAPLAASCISEFWDAKFYNWLSFQNNCGQAIHLSYTANNPNDTFGMSAADIAAGRSSNTGRSQSEVNQKGGFNLYVCPAGYVPVDPSTNQSVSGPNKTFTCKRW